MVWVEDRVLWIINTAFHTIHRTLYNLCIGLMISFGALFPEALGTSLLCFLFSNCTVPFMKRVQKGLNKWSQNLRSMGDKAGIEVLCGFDIWKSMERWWVWKQNIDQHGFFGVVTNIIVILQNLTKAFWVIGTVKMTLKENVKARASTWAALPGVVFFPSTQVSTIFCWPSHKVLMLHFSQCFRNSDLEDL